MNKQARINELAEIIKNAQNELIQLQNEVAQTKIKSNFKDGISFESILNTPVHILDRNYNFYKKINKWINQHLGITYGGYWVDTNQLSIQIMMKRNVPWENQQSIKLAFPYMKPLKDGFIHIKIFEHSLSEYGIYYLKIDPNDESEIKLCVKSYSLERVIETFSCWDDALKSIHKEYYYE